METDERAAAPESGIPTLEQLAEDEEIGALLDFTPVPRKVKRRDGWTPELQRQFIAWLAHHGSPARAAQQMSKNVSGIENVYREQGAESFRAAWDAALEIGQRRAAARERGPRFDWRAPGINVRPSTGSGRGGQPAGPLPGQVMNEFGEWEDEASIAARGAEAGRSICGKLVRIRRLYLQEISSCPGKRAAFEILTELPIDWDKAARFEPQADEPWHRCNQREPDMILTAESGWAFGEIGYGPDRKAQARAVIDAYRAKMDKPPIDWSGPNDRSVLESFPRD